MFKKLKHIQHKWKALKDALYRIRGLPGEVDLLKDDLAKKEKKSKELQLKIRFLESTHTLDGRTIYLQRARRIFNDYWCNIHTGIWTQSSLNSMDENFEFFLDSCQLPEKWFQNRRVLDVGCGSGYFSSKFMEIGSHITALDFSKFAIDRTRELCTNLVGENGNLQLVEMNIQHWEERAEFDFIICRNVIEYCVDPFKTIINLKHKLAPDGIIYLQSKQTLTKEDVLLSSLNLHLLELEEVRNELSMRFGQDVKKYFIPAMLHSNIFFEDELCQILKQLDFQIIKIDNSGQDTITFAKNK
ncbi:MAG: class I SAM-dependent methyltransferase [Anaerolineaceae bacterium]|nr:class I SAM-dependent methyltransferase [Anaerolineaceae bacterium]